MALAAAFALLLSLRGPEPQWRRTLAIGLCFLVGSLYKHVVVVQAGLLCLAYVMFAAPEQRRRALIQTAVIGAVGALGWLAVCGLFALRGEFADFYEWVFA